MISVFKNWLFVKMRPRKPDSERVISQINKIMMVSEKSFLEGKETYKHIIPKGKTVQDLNSYIEYTKQHLKRISDKIKHHQSCYNYWESALPKNTEAATECIKIGREEFDKLNENLNKKHNLDKNFKEKSIVDAGNIPIENKEKLTQTLMDLEIKMLRLRGSFFELNNCGIVTTEFNENYRKIRATNDTFKTMTNEEFDKKCITYMIQVKELEYVSSALSTINDRLLTPPPIPNNPDQGFEEEKIPFLEDLLTLKFSKNMTDIIKSTST